MFCFASKNFRGLLRALDNTLNAEQIFLYYSLSGSFFVRIVLSNNMRVVVAIGPYLMV